MLLADLNIPEVAIRFSMYWFRTCTRSEVNIINNIETQYTQL